MQLRSKTRQAQRSTQIQRRRYTSLPARLHTRTTHMHHAQTSTHTSSPMQTVQLTLCWKKQVTSRWPPSPRCTYQASFSPSSDISSGRRTKRRLPQRGTKAATLTDTAISPCRAAGASRQTAPGDALRFKNESGRPRPRPRYRWQPLLGRLGRRKQALSNGGQIAFLGFGGPPSLLCVVDVSEGRPKLAPCRESVVWPGCWRQGSGGRGGALQRREGPFSPAIKGFAFASAGACFPFFSLI